LGIEIAVGVVLAAGVEIEVGVEVSVRITLLVTSSGDVATASTACDVGPVCCPNLI
jgi:hypothetical protein